MVGVILRANGGVVKVGPDLLREFHPKLVMLHQPAAQFPVRGNAFDHFIPVQAASNAEHIIQPIDAFRIQRTGKELLLLRTHIINPQRQEVQLLNIRSFLQIGTSYVSGQIGNRADGFLDLYRSIACTVLFQFING